MPIAVGYEAITVHTRATSFSPEVSVSFPEPAIEYARATPPTDNLPTVCPATRSERLCGLRRIAKAPGGFEPPYEALQASA
jgi:hypothetical protein